MNIWLDDDVVIMDLIRALTAAGLRWSNVSGQSYIARIHRAEPVEHVTEPESARRNRKGKP